MEPWYEQHEQSAGTYRLELLWYIYRIMGVRVLKLILYPICFFITIFAGPARRASTQYRKILNAYQRAHNMHVTRFSSFTHIRMFANSLVDKISANCDTRPRIKITPERDSDWIAFEKHLNENRGVFLICSHLGNINAMAALSPDSPRTMHAFMQTGHTNTFNKFMSRHSTNTTTRLYSTENIDIGIAGQMYDNMTSGDMVMIAGDRISAQSPSRTVPIKFLGHDCALPIGTFKFARMMDHPVFSIAVMNTGGQNYKIYVRQLPTTDTDSLIQNYIDFLQDLTLRYPRQWFNFYGFFDTK